MNGFADNSKVRTFRRVVTTRDADGRSRVMSSNSAQTFGTLHEIWKTDGRQDPLSPDVEDTVLQRPLIAPPAGGTVFRFVEIEPESRFAQMDGDERRAAVREAFSSVQSEHALVDTSRHPAMHQTETIDYIVVLSGTLTMLLDHGEVELGPMDVVVQRGTNHAWVNQTEEVVLLAAVLVTPR